MSAAKSAQGASGLRPIVLYDHLPGILAGFPALIFLTIAVIVYVFGSADTEHAKGVNHMCFWIGLSMMIVWYVAYGFNMPQARFWLVFGLIGTFIGIPVVLELTGFIRPFTALGTWLGRLRPEVNASAWLVLALVMGIVWLINFIWSRTHLRVRIDESGLTLYRWGGRGERFELIGLKTENEPLDYLELFIAGIGSLSLKTRMNKPIFTMRRVVGLYRAPMFPFLRGKLSRIDELLSYHGKVISVDAANAQDLVAAEDDAEHDDAEDDADPHAKEIT